MGKKTKHLELIQGVVNRLSTNSFLHDTLSLNFGA
jgi:hypothetical protein